MCEAPVELMPTEKDMYVLDIDASVVATSGILHQKKNGKNAVLRFIAYRKKPLSDSELEYGAPKPEKIAVT